MMQLRTTLCAAVYIDHQLISFFLLSRDMCHCYHVTDVEFFLIRPCVSRHRSRISSGGPWMERSMAGAIYGRSVDGEIHGWSNLWTVRGWRDPWLEQSMERPWRILPERLHGMAGLDEMIDRQASLSNSAAASHEVRTATAKMRSKAK